MLWILIRSALIRSALDPQHILCILRHRGLQLMLAYSLARPAVLVAGKGRGGKFLFLLFLHFHSCSSFFSVPLFHLLFYLFSPFLWEMTQNDPQGLTCHSCRNKKNIDIFVLKNEHLIKGYGHEHKVLNLIFNMQLLICLHYMYDQFGCSPLKCWSHLQ